MPIELKYDSTIDALVMTTSGKIALDDVTALTEKIVAHPKFRTNINQLFDNTKGEFHLSTIDLELIAQHFLGISEVLGLDRRLALVVSRDIDYGMMRQYEVFFEAGPGVELQVFRSIDKARKWLQTG